MVLEGPAGSDRMMVPSMDFSEEERTSRRLK